MIIHDRPAMFPSWWYVEVGHIKCDKADVEICSKSNLNSQPASVGLIPSNASPEISQLLAVTTESEAAQHVTLNQSPPGLITNSHNFVVSGGKFTSAHTIVSHPTHAGSR